MAARRADQTIWKAQRRSAQSDMRQGRDRNEAERVMPRKKPDQPGTRWSQRVTESSNALDLEPRVFASRSPRTIAASLKRSADRSRRRKTTPFQSAMSMLVFYINRAGATLSAERRRVLTKAKSELRRLYGNEDTKPTARP